MRKLSRVLFVAVILSLALSEILLKAQNDRAVMNQQDSIRLPIIMYHSVTDEGKSPSQYVISPSMLEKDLNYIKQNNFNTVTVNDVIAYVNKEKPMAQNPIMLTFDDGYYNNYANVYPLMQKYNMKAVISPVGTLTERFTQADEKPHEAWSYCTEQEIKEMSDCIEFQNHSYDFHSLSPRKGCLRKNGEDKKIYQNIFEEDTLSAQKIFEKLDIQEPTCYIYPYGAMNNDTENMIKQLGFSASLGCEEGCNTITVGNTDCLYKMHRYNRDGRSSIDTFWGMISDDMKER